jgi:hypothetical protein
MHMAGWELIESASDSEKDGHDLLVATVPGGRRQVAHWSAAAPGAWIGDDGKPLTPSHYMELPEAPKAADPEARAKAKAAAEAKAEAKAKAEADAAKAAEAKARADDVAAKRKDS